MDSKQDLKEEIAKVAYEIYEQMGISGREVENWLEAERIVLERLSVREPSEAAKKFAPSRKKGGTKKQSDAVVARASTRSNLINAVTYGIASSAFGLLAMTNGAFFKGLDVLTE
ncbi:MAG: DUF2934 domain-containing protein, partial [Syntrophaceae bacterium]|nr:DUF2934 domain-containing protein [Pseudomonadota bacterium]MCG2739388.1 DUF2934 domain-containing protein [Syntrophaceae bacterium]